MMERREQLLTKLDNTALQKQRHVRGSDEWVRLQNLQVRILGDLDRLDRSAEVAEPPTYAADGLLTYRARLLPLRVVA